MAKSSLHLNHAGLMAALKQPGVAAAVNKAAEEIAEKVRAHSDWDGLVSGVPGSDEMPVTVTTYTSDRDRASVFLAHPAGLAVQAKHGALTKAAAELGLEVNG